MNPEKQNFDSEPDSVETENGVEVPLVVTRDMEQQLVDKGSGGEDINKLKPEDAGEILNEEKSEEQPMEKPGSSLEGQSENLDEQSEARQQEITRLTESVEETKAKLNEAREKLGLPPTEEDPPSVFLEKDKLEKLKAKQEALEKQNEELESQEDKREDKQESKEGNEDLKENDLIVSDIGIEPAKKILEESEIQYKDREHTKRQTLDAKTGAAIPGEFVLTIFDPGHPDRPASFDFVKQVFKLIKDSDVAVRYGKNPERG